MREFFSRHLDTVRWYIFTGLSAALKHNLLGILPPAFSGVSRRLPYRWSEFDSQSIFLEFMLFEGIYGSANPVTFRNTRYLVLSQFGSRKERETEIRRKECERNVAEGRNGNYRRQRK